MEALVFAVLVLKITVACNVEGRQQKGERSVFRLLGIFFLYVIGHLQQFDGGGIFTNHDVSEMLAKAYNKVVPVEPCSEYFIESKKRRRQVLIFKIIRHL